MINGFKFFTVWKAYVHLSQFKSGADKYFISFFTVRVCEPYNEPLFTTTVVGDYGSETCYLTDIKIQFSFQFNWNSLLN